LQTRVIPSLLIHKGGLVKSVQFKDYKYVGDPINAVKIFNEKEVDEIAVIDIDASRENKAPNIGKIAEIASEAFMPMAYGGGITTIAQIKEILYNGIEKVIINKAAHTTPNLITEAANLFGNQSIVVSIDVKKVFLKGYRVFIENGKKNTGLHPVEFAITAQNLGAGEILLNSIDKDGTFTGYDLSLIQQVSQAVNIPVIALGGATTVTDFVAAKQAGASALAAGSMFVFQRPHKAVLISYPTRKELKQIVHGS
jgi:cyclase